MRMRYLKRRIRDFQDRIQFQRDPHRAYVHPHRCNNDYILEITSTNNNNIKKDVSTNNKNHDKL